MHSELWGTICTYAVGVYLVSEESLLRCRSALFGACRWKTTFKLRRRRCFVRKRVARRFHMSRTTFHEWVKIKDGRRCSEEVVAKGKGHARKTGRRRRGRARRRPIKEQSARAPPSSGPEQPCHPWASGGYGRARCAPGLFHYKGR